MGALQRTGGASIGLSVHSWRIWDGEAYSHIHGREQPLMSFGGVFFLSVGLHLLPSALSGPQPRMLYILLALDIYIAPMGHWTKFKI